MTLSVLLGAMLIGAGVGLLSGAFGKGGSAVATPLLHWIGVPAMAAVASPLPAVIPSSLAASRPYARSGNIDRRVMRLGIIFGVPATALGALATRWIGGGTLVLATDILVLFMALRVLLRSAEHADTPDAASRQRTHAPLVAGVACSVGLLSGLLGNGGGFLLAPLFMNVLRMPVRRALGTSLLLSVFFAVPGTIVHAWLGHINWTLTFAFGLASVPLAAYGARLALRIKERSLTVAYGFGLATLAGGLLLFAH